MLDFLATATIPMQEWVEWVEGKKGSLRAASLAARWHGTKICDALLMGFSLFSKLEKFLLLNHLKGYSLNPSQTPLL